MQHEGNNHCLNRGNAEQMEDKKQTQERNDKEECFLGINFLFIGAKSLGTPNDMAPRNAPLEVTCRLATTSITTPLHKCPSRMPRVMQSLKRFEKCFNPSFLSGRNNQVKRGHYRDFPMSPRGRLPWPHVTSFYFCQDKHNQIRISNLE